MKKRPKIIQISGTKGILFLMFLTVCLFAGFVVFPARVAMHVWNFISSTYYIVPEINIWQGLMLWAIIAITAFIIDKPNKIISVHKSKELDDAEMEILMDRIRMQQQAQKLNAMLVKDLKILSKNKNSEKNEATEQNSNNINEKHL